MVSLESEVPNRALILDGLTVSSTGPGSWPRMSIDLSASSISSPPVRARSWQKRVAARSMPSGSQPRSNLVDASVLSPSRLEVRATAMGTK